MPKFAHGRDESFYPNCNFRNKCCIKLLRPPPFQSPSFNVGDDRLIFKIGQGTGLAVHATLKPGVKRGIAGICQQRILGKTFVTALCIFQGLSPYKSLSNPRSDHVFGVQTWEKSKVRMS